MAYTGNTLSMWAGGPIEGAFKLWAYTTADSNATYTAAGYITDASNRGMLVGDFVMVSNSGTPAQSGFCQVTAITAGAATLTNLVNA